MKNLIRLTRHAPAGSCGWRLRQLPSPPSRRRGRDRGRQGQPRPPANALASQQGRRSSSSRSSSTALLTIEGTERERQDRASPEGRRSRQLQVDFGDDGSADFSFRASTSRRSTSRPGRRRPRADRREQRRLHRHHPDDASTAATETTRSSAARAARRCSAAPATTRSTATAATTRPCSGRRRHLRLGSGRRQRHDRRPGRHRHDGLQRRQRQRESTCPRTATGSAFFRDPGNITMDTTGVERVDFNALGGADSSPSTT